MVPKVGLLAGAVVERLAAIAAGLSKLEAAADAAADAMVDVAEGELPLLDEIRIQLGMLYLRTFFTHYDLKGQPKWNKIKILRAHLVSLFVCMRVFGRYQNFHGVPLRKYCMYPMYNPYIEIPNTKWEGAA